jgi:hypothetical protein
MEQLKKYFEVSTKPVNAMTRTIGTIWKSKKKKNPKNKHFPIERSRDPSAHPDGRYRLRLRVVAEHLEGGQALRRQLARLQAGREDERQTSSGSPMAPGEF